MSSHAYDDLPDREAPQTVWSATVAVAPVDFADLIAVIIPGLDNDLQWKDCKWQARDTINLPARGDKCLVIFDDNNELWVVAWWPF